MATNSTIEWTDSTWNPIVGCSHASAGCKNCYAERMAHRQAHMEDKREVPAIYGRTIGYDLSACGHGKWNGTTVFVESALDKPLHWRKPRKIFVCSMSDLFHPSVPFEWIAQIYAVAAICRRHTFQILTKRIERALEFEKWLKPQWYKLFPGGENHPYAKLDMDSNVVLQFSKLDPDIVCGECDAPAWPLPNVWLGTTVEHPDYKPRIDELRKIPAAVRFLSFEPLLADPGEIDLTGIGWVIAGGESGPGARPMHPDWARSLRDQCEAADVPFFFKQWGQFLPESQYESMAEDVWREIDGDGIQPGLCGIGDLKVWKLGKKKAGCLLDGVEYKEFPEAILKIEAACIKCGCTDEDCSRCIADQDEPCYWVSSGKCSRCFDDCGNPKKQESEGSK